jgi:uncharacterized protein YfaS (alpha-2-macroglobulin family)
MVRLLSVRLSAWLIAYVCLGVGVARAQEAPLTVVSVGPQGEIASRDHANEIRVVFSEPMVVMGRVPEPVTAPFFTTVPAVTGTFRWSGTTTLIFTPDPKEPLPLATTYTVTIGPMATAVTGRRLSTPVSFRFTTPTVRLLRTDWYRRGGTADGGLIVLLRFNQPVNPVDIAQHTRARLEPHDWRPPAFSKEEESRLASVDAKALEQFRDKVRVTQAIAGSNSAVGLRLTKEWDRERYPAANDLVVFEAVERVRPESWVRIELDATLPSPAGSATPGLTQDHTLQVEPAFFIDGFECRSECDADRNNPIVMRSTVKVADFASALAATDITETPRAVARRAQPRVRDEFDAYDEGDRLTLEDAGYDPQPPNRRYLVAARPDLRSSDGQALGYHWVGIVDNWNARAFTSFGDGHGVWEKDGGTLLPFHARNMRDITQWVARVEPGDLMPRVLELQNNGFRQAPASAGAARRLAVTPNTIQSHGIDLSPALKNGSGLVWTAVREEQAIARARLFSPDRDERVKSSLVQATNLGLTVKDSPQNTLVFVTRLDTGAPVAGAKVSIVTLSNTVHWSGVTGADGVAVAPNTPLRDRSNWYRFSFLVLAEKDGDVAYVGSDWNEGIAPWDFNAYPDLYEAEPMLRGSVFTDRGVYRLGEQVHFKAILRQNTPTGVRLLSPGTPIVVTLRDGQNRLVDERRVTLSGWSSADWTLTLPENGTLGNYSLRARLESEPPTARDRTREADDPESEYGNRHNTVFGSFLVAAYRRPDFRVDVTLSSGSALAGDPLTGVVSARYLFGAPMGERPVSWRYRKSPVYSAPRSITDRYGEDRWVFVGYPELDEGRVAGGDIRADDAALAANGELRLALDTTLGAGVPYAYSLEGDVEDVSRQHIANRATWTVHPAPWYVGIRRPPYFLEHKTGLATELIVSDLNGQLVAGVPLEAKLTQVQWQSVRRAEGNGFYGWETRRVEVPAGEWVLTSASEPVPLAIQFKSGGYYVLEVTGRGNDQRFTVTRTSFYVLGDGYTAWARYDHNRIDLVPERQTYKPGDVARVMIQSPWEDATALMTIEREGVKTHRQFRLTSTQQSLDVPITEGDIPNVFVSVVLIKGRTTAASATTDASDPGKPSFRMGYVELNVEDRSKRLTVGVTANREEYRPAATAQVRVDVKDAQGRGTASEVTLWAVDYGVLSLTGYRTPDVLGTVYVRKALQVINADSRQRIVSRRVLTPKGATDGGGGGADAGAGTLRKDFRVLAFWLGSVITDANGRAQLDVKLPESLTTYRIMAVAADRASRFGAGDAEVRTNKPLTMKPAFPRFLAVGDTAQFGAVVGSQLRQSGIATVRMRSLDPAVLAIAGGEQRVTIPANGAIEVRFQGAGRSIGRARLQMTVQLGNESDAFEDVIPVSVLVSPETVAAVGEANDARTTATEMLAFPEDAVPGFGGLHVELASTALVGLGEGARYLVEYPYGCAEQKGSRALAMLLTADLGDAFTLPGVDPKTIRPTVQRTLGELARFQCVNGGFAYWPGECASVSPYLTSYLLHVFKTAADLKFAVDREMLDRAYTYLERELAKEPPQNAAWWPSYLAWQSFAIKVLVEGGRNQDSNLTRLFGYRDRMPVFALAYLHDALGATGEAASDRAVDLQRRLRNAIVQEAATAHVEELNDPYLLWFWNSNVRSTAIVLNSLVRATATSESLSPMVRWMMNVREKGRWGNTQENAHALEALVAYYRKFERVVPDFRAVVRLGDQDLARDEFKGRSTTVTSRQVPMAQLQPQGPGAATGPRPLAVSREGVGTLHYTARLRYAVDRLFQEGLDAGIQIARRYEPYAENGPRPAATSYQAGDLVRVTLTLRLTQERRFVAVTDPLPAGFEAVETWFDTTTARLAGSTRDSSSRDLGADAGDDSWMSWWRHGGFDHVERHDDRVQLFATRLAEGLHEFSYVVRATTAGTFRTAPAHAEQMYEPEVFGRTASATIGVKP